MKKRILSLVLVAILVFALTPQTSAASEGPTFAPATTVEQRIDEIKRMADKYSHTSKYILESQASSKATTVDGLISRWVRGTKGSFNDIFSQLATSVHEEYHGFQFVAAGSRQLVDNRETTISYSRSSIVKTENATGNLPENKRTFRWDTYVSPNAAASSNVYGAYGLLDELSAYYYDCRAVTDCVEYLLEYINKNGFSHELVSGYFTSTVNDVVAFHEFTYWTLEYLLYLKEHHPSNYNAIMDNAQYRDSFVYFHNNFSKMEEDVLPKNKEMIFNYLRGKGIGVRETADAIWLGDIGIGTDVYTNDIATVKNVMREAKYIAMLNELLSRPSPAPSPPPTSTSAPAGQTATPSAWTVSVDGGAAIACDAYSIGGNNYFKFRDLAMMLNGTDKQFDFEVGAAIINLLSGNAYTPVGGELAPGDGQSRTTAPSRYHFALDGKAVELTAYVMGGNNYVRLRDVLRLLDVGVGFDTAKREIYLDTLKPYAD